MLHRCHMAALVPLLAILSASCSATSEQDATVRDPSGAVESAGDVGVFALQLADCFNDPSLSGATVADEAAEIEEVSAVPCDTPHDFQVFGQFDVSDATEYPGETALVDQADTGCVDRFEAFVGLDFASSRYGLSYLYPTPDTWAAGDREILCSLGDPAGEKLTADAQGSAQ